MIDDSFLEAAYEDANGAVIDEANEAFEDEDEDKLGSCGCIDYHMADCPTRTGYEYEQEPWDDGMDGDAGSALASIGWGTDEDYGHYGDDGGW